MNESAHLMLEDAADGADDIIDKGMGVWFYQTFLLFCSKQKRTLPFIKNYRLNRLVDMVQKKMLTKKNKQTRDRQTKKIRTDKAKYKKQPRK